MDSPSTKYSDAKIYKLVAPGTLDCYIGSTCSTLEKRLYQHNYACANITKTNQCQSLKLYEMSNKISIQLIELFPCKSKEELNMRERYWIENTPNVLNKNIPGRGWKERWESNKEHNSIKHKEYLKAHKEEIAEKRRSPEMRARENELRALRMQDPEYAKAQKERMSANKKIRVLCPHCKKEMNKNSLSDHIKRTHKQV